MLIQALFHPSDNRFTQFYPQIVRFLTAGGRYGKALGTGQCPVPGHLVTLGTPVLATSKNWPCTGHSIWPRQGFHIALRQISRGLFYSCIDIFH